MDLLSGLPIVLIRLMQNRSVGGGGGGTRKCDRNVFCSNCSTQYYGCCGYISKAPRTQLSRRSLLRAGNDTMYIFLRTNKIRLLSHSAPTSWKYDFPIISYHETQLLIKRHLSTYILRLCITLSSLFNFDFYWEHIHISQYFFKIGFGFQ